MRRSTVCVETSVVSYLTARPTGDLLAAAWQKITVDWWETRRSRFDLHASDVTIEEAAEEIRRHRRGVSTRWTGIPVLPITEAVIELSRALVGEGALPAKALNDALHVAVSAVHGVDCLLTWNFRPLDNAEVRPVIRSVCARHGHAGLEIRTPRELMGDLKDVR